MPIFDELGNVISSDVETQITKQTAAAETADSVVEVDIMGNVTGITNLSPTEEKQLNAGAGRGGQGGPTTAELAAAQQAATVGGGRGGQGGPTAEQLQQDQEEKAAAAKPSPAAVALSAPRPNPLFEYANYTYSLSMHIVPPTKYNELMNGVVEYVPTYNGVGTVLIASGGRRAEGTFGRHPRFKEDFFFEGFKMSTVVGMNTRSKNANTIELSFTIVEPYGLTLFDRILGLASDIGAKNWMEMPFLMQIDFYGNTDEGNLMNPIPDQTKYIPFRLIAVKTKVTGRGAEYQCQAIPYSHHAYSESNASTPAFFEVTATTVKDFFSATGSAGEATASLAVNAASKERMEAELADAARSRNRAVTEAAIRKRYADINTNLNATPYQVGSYAAAMNSYQKELVKNKNQDQPTIYVFEFTDPAMLDSKIVFPPKTVNNRTPMTNIVKEGVSAARAAAGLPVAGVKTDTEVFAINAGTSVIDVINSVMRNSEYIRSQLSDPSKTANANAQEIANKEGKPINWYKIVPKLEIMDFDKKQDIYAKRITFYIQPYKYYNSKFKDAPVAQPDAYSKEYHYLYTGKNDSIINFDIDFDTMFYTSITANREKVQKTVVQPEVPPTADEPGGTGDTTVTLQSKQTKYISGHADVPNPASPDPIGVLVNDFHKSMLSSSRGDMINVNLKIVGDPEFIKQDDVYFNPSNNPSQGTQTLIDKHNSIIFDAAEIFALLTFRTPVDIDDNTGLMNFDPESTTSSFSGLYKVITVDHEFQSGQFTQNLTLIRVWDQAEYDKPATATANSKSARAAEVTTPAEAKAAVEDEFGLIPDDNQSAAEVNRLKAREADANPETGPANTNSVSNASQDDGSYDRVTAQKALQKNLANVVTTDITEIPNLMDFNFGIGA